MSAKKQRVLSAANVQRQATHHLHVSNVLCVEWSNGAGFTLYRVDDNPKAARSSCGVCDGTGMVEGDQCRNCTTEGHAFECLGDYEYVEGGCVPTEL